MDPGLRRGDDPWQAAEAMIAAPGLDVPLELRLRLADLYAAYDATLDENELEKWPDFFTEACLYKVIPRENYELGLPVGMLSFESRAMLADRVVALRETMFFAPRTLRRLVGAPTLRSVNPDGYRLTATFALFETMLNEPSALFLCGRFHDRVVEDGGALRFAERVCVADATNVPTSLVFPI